MALRASHRSPGDERMGSIGKSTIAVFLVFLVAGSLLLWHAQKHEAINLHIEPVTLISLLLAASGLILTAAAIFVALLGIFGYREIVQRAGDVARSEANRVA